jgi:hypothetical protein
MFSLPHGETRFHSDYGDLRPRLTAITDFSLPHSNFSRLSGNIIIYLALLPRLSGDIKRASIWPRRCASPAIAPVIELAAHWCFRQAAGPVDQRWCCFSYNAMQQRAFCISPTLTQGFRSSVLVLLLL